jgi:hypothetical protein
MPGRDGVRARSSNPYFPNMRDKNKFKNGPFAQPYGCAKNVFTAIVGRRTVTMFLLLDL